MILINNPYTEPYFNMAVEEYFFNKFTEEVFILWRNDSAVIVGKNQNAAAEINIPYIEENNIKVVRRLSGGGAVFHDLGNLNFTFIKTGSNPDFNEFTQPIIDYLQSIGVNASFQGRNDISIDGKKISGNAIHIKGNRILGHGTLLYSSEIKDISQSLLVDPRKFDDKAVKSVRSRVTNISSHLENKISIDEFRNNLFLYINNYVQESKEYTLTETDIEQIKKLEEEKYSTWDWNFGKSPKYNFKKSIRTKGGTVEVQLYINNGMIENIRIFGDYFGVENISGLEKLLVGCKHNKDSIQQVLGSVDTSVYILNATSNELIEAFI